MPTLITQVDRTTGNYQDTFTYTINASFNGIEGEIDSAQIRIFVPDYFSITLDDIQKPINEVIEEETETGTTYIFDLGRIEDLGISLRFSFDLNFQLIAESGTSYKVMPELWINGELLLTSESEIIYLEVITNFLLSREVVLPKVPPAAGGAVFYKVRLENSRDLGGIANDITITCYGREDFLIDSTFAIIGNDVSSDQFSDTTADGIIGIVSDNKVTFTIPSYRGEAYEFIYRGELSDSLLSGMDLDTLVTWSMDGISQEDDLDTIPIDEEIYDATFSLYGPDYTLPNRPILYQVSLENIGNQVLENVNFTLDLPSDINFYEFNTGSFYISEINQSTDAEYNISYTTQNGLSGSLGPYNTKANTTVALNTLLDEGDNLATLIWNLNTLGIGVKQQSPPRLKGVVSNTAVIGRALLNQFQMTWAKDGVMQEVNGNQSALSEDICVLQPIFSQSINGNSVRPGDRFQYTIGANCIRSRLNTPIFGFLLPAELTYIGNPSIQFTGVFSNLSEPILPPARIVPNAAAGGKTFISFEFEGAYAFDFPQQSKIRITFDVEVMIGAREEFSAIALLNTIESSGQILSSGAVYKDEYNLAGNDDVAINYARSGFISNSILFFVSVSSNKQVRGALDTFYMEEPLIGSTLAGGEIDYRIRIRNIGNADLEMIEVIDILPHIGDTGVIGVNSARDSEFFLYNINEAFVQIIQNDGSVISDVKFETSYSTSYDPLRFGSRFNMIGSDSNWTLVPPKDLTTIKSYKIRTVDSKLLPNETLEIILKTLAPVGVSPNQVAWNSFAADVVYRNSEDELEHLLAIEPEKVGIQVVENPVGKGSISGFVWFDDDNDGLYTEGEQGIDDVGVVLYDKAGTPLKATFTTTSLDGRVGYYTFGNLDISRYRLRFFIDDNEYQYTKQRIVSLGSLPDASTGITGIIDLTDEPNKENLSAGIVIKEKHVIDQILEVNRSARGMIRNVIYDQMLIGMKLEDTISVIE